MRRVQAPRQRCQVRIVRLSHPRFNLSSRHCRYYRGTVDRGIPNFNRWLDVSSVNDSSSAILVDCVCPCLAYSLFPVHIPVHSVSLDLRDMFIGKSSDVGPRQRRIVPTSTSETRGDCSTGCHEQASLGRGVTARPTHVGVSQV